MSQPFPTTALRRRHAQTVRDTSLSYKIDCHSDQDLSKSHRASKSVQWFKSYGLFTEEVDFACWWSFSGGGSAIDGATQSSLKAILIVFRMSLFGSNSYFTKKSS